MNANKCVLEARMLLALTGQLPVTSVSPEIEVLLGFSPDDFLAGKVSLKSRIHAHDQDIADELFSSTIHPPSGTFNLRLRQANGRIRCVKVHYQKYPDQSGAATLLDLLLQDSKSLQQAQDEQPMMASFKVMMDNTKDYIYVKDRHHVCTAASQTLVDFVDSASHWTDLIGLTVYDVFEEDYADVYYRQEKHVLAGLAVTAEVQETLTKDGLPGWIDHRIDPIRDEKGEITGLMGIARDITEIKQVESTLAASEQRFQTIFEQTSSISVQGYDSHRRVIYWNPASERLYGFTREQALGRRLEDLIIPEPMRETVVRLVTDWTQGGQAIASSNLTLQDADGKPVHVFSSHVMLRHANGEAEMYCIDIDMAEHKRAEKALFESENLFRTMIDEIPDPVVLKDYEGNFLLCNKTVAGLYNTTPEAMVGKHDGDFGVPQELADFFRSNVLAIMAKGETEVVYEDSRDALTGAIRHYKSIKKPFKNGEGKDQILVIAQDITDIVNAQELVAENERRLQEVMAITQEGVWDWHVPTGRVLHNPEWYKTLGTTPSDSTDTVEAFAALIHLEDKEMVLARLDAMLKGETDVYSSEHRLLDQEGKVLWVQDRGRVMERDAKGAPVRVVGSFSDITFRKEYQHKLEHFAHYDTLTGLPNRVLLGARMREAMTQAQRDESKLMVAYIDL
ncbi:MAG: PAS domain S-box protein, partial [Pseudomonadota bacterium]